MESPATLQSTRHDLLIVEERSRSDIVIGAPHHAPAGTPRMPCPEHSDSDENTGLLGRRLAQRLDCCSIIAGNASVDPNKHPDSGYAQQIARWRPRILIEIHGHGKVRSPFDVEISCGSADHSGHAEALAAALRRRISGQAEFADVTVCGRFDDIYFKATKTPTITDARWLAYHIELSSRLRKPTSGPTGPPTDWACRFCDHLADALQATLG
ncbi:MAG TPA: hypothetical protein VLT88_11080 [Desulfosarcina sp.]|nr:hypothetical protein [Desulfosarcina sp.]